MFKDVVIPRALCMIEKHISCAEQASERARNLAVAERMIPKAVAQVSASQCRRGKLGKDLRNSTISALIDGLVLSLDVNVGRRGQLHPLFWVSQSLTLIMTRET